MSNKSKTAMVFVMAAAMIALPLSATAFADNEAELAKSSTFNSFIDAVVLRPIGLIAIPVGFGAFVIALPFSAIGGNTKDSFESLVKKPAKFTFDRPLGDFD